jgi:hypothetical protein
MAPENSDLPPLAQSREEYFGGEGEIAGRAHDARSLFALAGSGGVDKDELGILFSRDGEFGFVDGGDAATDRNPLSIDEDHATGGAR